MKLNNNSMLKKIIAVLVVVLLIVGIAVTIFLVQKRQETRTQAEGNVTISLTTPDPTVPIDSPVDIDINIDPGTNQVNIVKLKITYDGTKFTASESDFTINPDLGLTQASALPGEGSFSFTLTSGDDPTKVINTASKIGTLKLTPKVDAQPGETNVQIVYKESEVKYVTDLSAESISAASNLLAVGNGLTITTEAVCRANIASCKWDPVEGVTKYKVKITNITDNVVLLDGNITGTSTEFTAASGKNYTCEVRALQDCGTLGEAGIGENLCGENVTVTPRPTTSVTPIVTPNVTSTVTPKPTTVIGATSTPTPTPTTTPIGGIEEETPTPTEVPGITVGPTLPPTGNPFVIGGIIGGLLIVIGGIALLLL